jgi:hypothetical protein
MVMNIIVERRDFYTENVRVKKGKGGGEVLELEAKMRILFPVWERGNVF